MTRSGTLGTLNLGLRFLLEVTAIAALAYWGWTTQQGLFRVLAAVGLPALAAVLWGTFRTTGDDRDLEAAGNAEPRTPIVAVPGVLRLALELVLFGSAVGLLVLAGRTVAAAVLGLLVLVHYGLAHERVRWLLGGQSNAG